MAVASSFTQERERMVQSQIAARGVRDRAVLQAMRTVPRERFISEDMAEFAYEDTPLPIEESQTISQPYIVALMAAELGLKGTDRVLEIGAGSGYAAAVLSRVAGEVYTVERHEALADLARNRLRGLGYDNVHVLCGDGSLGWPEHAPYDKIVVAAGAPAVPETLMKQLKIGGRLVIPVGETQRLQKLFRITRVSEEDYHREDLGDVRFVSLIGAEGWREDEPEILQPTSGAASPSGTISRLLHETGEPIADIERVDLGPLLERIGGARLVLLGEATHGTSEFYRMRARITRELIVHRGFNMIAVEADWPDAVRVDRYIRHEKSPEVPERAFTRFPTWMWRNREVHDLVEWLRAYNDDQRDPSRQVGFHGLDLYSLFTSIDAVIRYLDGVDPEAARVARRRYGCLTPWERDPAVYGRAAITGRYRLCENQVVAMLRDMMARRLDYAERDGDRYLEAMHNARLVASAERYYRVMYYGSRESWNLRDEHMFETLRLLLASRGPEAKAVVWEHNSHIGDAAATEMGVRGEHNVGYLCRGEFGDGVRLVGFGTDHGTVAAASEWDGPMEVKNVRPAHQESYERLCHNSGRAAFLLHLREPAREAVREELMQPRLERAIGVIYRPETELASHYFQACLPRQFDEYIWFDETRAVTPLSSEHGRGMPETYPFGL